MKVSSLVFACHSKACAPPPVGTGGSRSSGGGGRSGKKISSVSAAYNEAKVRSSRGEKMTKGKIKEIWDRNTTPGRAKDKGPGFSQGGIGGSHVKDKSNDRGPKLAKGAGADKSNDRGPTTKAAATQAAGEALGSSLSGKRRATERYTAAYQAGKALPDSVKAAIKADKTYKILNNLASKHGDHAGDGFADGVNGWKADSARYRPNGLRKNEKDLLPGEKGYRGSKYSTDKDLYGE